MNKAIIFCTSLIFTLFFVFQQIFSFVDLAENINERYWQIVYAFLLIISVIEMGRGNGDRTALYFVLISIIGTISTIISGRPIGKIILYSLYAIAGYGGLSYIKNNKINPNILGVLLVILYYIFYMVYFQYRHLNIALEVEGYLFGHSSSNTIAMSLNFVLWVYFFIDYTQEHKNSLWVFCFSVINLFLIFIQASRAGLIVAAVLFVMSYFALAKKTESKIPKYVFYLSIIIVLLLIPRHFGFIQEYSRASSFDSLNFTHEIRGHEIALFFTEMDPIHFLFGYGDDSIFKNGRTFNAFLDFWDRYGIIPFVFLLTLIYRRIKNRKQYSISLWVFLPMILYAFAETIFGGTLWDFSLYLFLFYR